MSESQTETFTERVDVITQPDGAFIGTLEVEVRQGDDQHNEIAALRAENLTLRNRVRELEAALNAID
jgi:hypothetical protein